MARTHRHRVLDRLKSFAQRARARDQTLDTAEICPCACCRRDRLPEVIDSVRIRIDADHPRCPNGAVLEHRLDHGVRADIASEPHPVDAPAFPLHLVCEHTHRRRSHFESQDDMLPDRKKRVSVLEIARVSVNRDHHGVILRRLVADVDDPSSPNRQEILALQQNDRYEQPVHAPRR